ncbi:terpene cyclase/mutase family protein [Telmatocola sphagniphila]|uniref:Terpene cyclase/mutase family protein n=1 Tax=Telmatocola sphagniphila TaxID=1123043 RepID=A0A8E6ETH9_9BACT|nr:prenyltransferase/squalene oxidase repeat-containing protein [Telmatocola sphagniphila]QVL29962.1 terpene cyclase/mutase family protein [Telmatocola sphagniphila]
MRIPLVGGSVVRIYFSLLMLLAIPTTDRAADPEEFEIAVARGLEFLRSSQMINGSWMAGNQSRDPSITALCTMAFLSAGHVPGEGKYAQTVEKGIDYILACQQKSGLFTFPNGQKNNFEMYCHGICTLTLAECVGMLPDDTRSKQLRQAVEKGVKIILQGQRKQNGPERGGWRYMVNGTDSDLSVTGWQLMALRAAKNIGCDVPGEVIEEAIEYIRRCQDPQTGGYRYQPHNQVTIACTGTAILSLELSGKEYHRSKEAIQAGNFLLRRDNQLVPNRVHFFYGTYYTTQAMFQLGENYWELHRSGLHQLLLKHLPQRNNGGWYSLAADDNLFGPNYCTAMAVLSLTVEFRYLPIYQRGEDK